MLTECHSPKQKCLSIPICHPTINCCNCPTICITNCCPQTPLMTFPSDNCEEKNKNKLLYELSSSIPSSQYITTPSSQIFTNQFRNSTPDIIKLHSKTNSYFNIPRNSSNDFFINNLQNPNEDEYSIIETNKKKLFF